PPPRPLRRPPRQAQKARRQDQQHRLRHALPVSPRHLHPPAGLGNRTPARRIHPRHQPRQTHRPPQPRATTDNPTHPLTPHPDTTLDRETPRARQPPPRPGAPAPPNPPGPPPPDDKR